MAAARTPPIQRILDALCWLPRLHERDLLRFSLESPAIGPLLMPSLFIWVLLPCVLGFMSFYFLLLGGTIILGPGLGVFGTLVALALLASAWATLIWFWRAFRDHSNIFARNDRRRAEVRLAILDTLLKIRPND